MVGGLANQIAGGGSGLYNAVVAGNGNIIGASVVSSAIVGGISNGISGVSEYCVILGGNSNLVDTVQYSGIIAGRDIEVTSPYSAGIAGQDNIIDGTHSVILGGQTNTLNGTRSVILAGDNNTIDVGASFVTATGANVGAALGKSLTVGGGYYTVNTERGTLQMIFVNVGRLVTHGSAAWSRLLIEPAGGGSGELVIPTDSAWAFDVMCVGTTQGCAKTFSFRTFGILENDGGTVSLLAVPTIVTVYDGDDVSFDMRVLADDGANSLAIEVSDSDGAGDIVRWGALVKIEQVKFST
jgi:hypothetical protein